MIDGVTDRYSEFDEGCTCGQVLDHLSVCVAFVRSPDGDGSLFPDAEVRRYRESVLDGVDPVSESALDAAGWRAELQRSDESRVRSVVRGAVRRIGRGPGSAWRIGSAGDHDVASRHGAACGGCCSVASGAADGCSGGVGAELG